jgi:hypothetical protein
VFPIEVETDFDSFMKTDINVSTLRDTFVAAKGSLTDESRRLQGAMLYTRFNLFLTYEMKESSAGVSVMDNGVLAEINRFEQELMALPDWSRECNRIDERMRALCNPGLTFAGYAYPGVQRPSETDVVPTVLNFDGTGLDPLPLAVVISAMAERRLTNIVFPKSFNNSAPLSTRILRSAFQFKYDVARSFESAAVMSAATQQLKSDWKELMSGEVLEKLQAGSDPDSDLPFRVFFKGHQLEEIEVMEALAGDIRLATGSMCFVLAYMIFHTGSIFLSIAGIVIVLLAVPLSYVCFQALAGQTTMSIASVLSLFLVVGLGSDVIFVFTDVWRDSLNIKDDHVSRMGWTLFHAGKASLATSLTTALSFFANLVSVLRPLREFGVFMGLCVLLVWLLVVSLYAPLCLVDELWFHRCSLHKIVERSANWRAALLGVWARHLHPWRKFFLVSFPVLMIVCLLPAALMAEVDTGLPDIFPSDHNRNRGTLAFDHFEGLDHLMSVEYMPPSTVSRVCEEAAFDPNDATCPLFWCEVPQSAAHVKMAPEGTCQCWQKTVATTCNGQAAAVVNLRVVGMPSLSPAQEASVGDYLAEHKGSSLQFQSADPTAGMAQQALSDIVLQEWETGQVVYKPMMQLITSLPRTNVNSSRCSWNELCFCGTYTCTVKDGWKVGNSFPMASRRLNALFVETVPVNSQASIDVVFGIEALGSSPLLGQREADDTWGFLDGFDVSQPWAQRNLYAFCTKFSPEMRVVDQKMSCWIKDFKIWLDQRQERFPVPQHKFAPRVAQYLSVGLTGPPGDRRESKNFIWIRNNVIKACYMVFTVDVNKNGGVDIISKYKEHWDSYLSAWNEDASQFAERAWHTSFMWVRMEAQQQLVSSTVLTLVLVVVLAAIGMLAFTLDPVLSLYVVIATVGVMCGLTFFIIVAMGWAIGPIEVIALIVFIGYAVTYSLHIAHRYTSNEGPLVEPLPLEMDTASGMRFQRTSFALKSIGGAALGSAVTTMGCSIFLLFCTLTIFKKLGGVVLAVTLMSIYTALVPLPAALLVIGPLHPGYHIRRAPNIIFGMLRHVVPSMNASGRRPPAEADIPVGIVAHSSGAAVTSHEYNPRPIPSEHERPEQAFSIHPPGHTTQDTTDRYASPGNNEQGFDAASEHWDHRESL